MKMLLVLFVLQSFIFKNNVFAGSNENVPTDSSLRYEAPDDCQWWVRGQGASAGQDEVALTCNLRTINSEFDTTNFSVIPSEHTTSLRIECNQDILSRSSLDDRSFVHLSKLRALELEHCKLSRWPAGTLLGLRDLRNLTVRTHNTDWEKMNLEFSRGSFNPVRQLERLDLCCNNIWSFPESIFCPLINLGYLNVSRNRLQDVSDLGFREKTPGPQPLISVTEEEVPRSEESNLTPPCSMDIQTLDASFNHFVLLPANGFSVLKRLKELYIHNNEINTIADKALDGLKALQTIDLSNNKLVALPIELFNDCRETIREIYLQNNTITVLGPGLFGNLTQLLALDLSRNLLTISWINQDTFAGLIRLVLLNLSYNRITHLDHDLFHDLYTLQILNLEHNALETIPADTFAPMNNLHTLIISYNRITYLDAYSLNGLYVLSLLALDNNILEGIHPEAFRNCSSLQDLNLNSNQLKAVPLALKNMRLLRTLDLGENLITYLEEPGFRGLNNLYGLRMLGNRIQNITKRAFADLPALQILNLARNRVQRVEHNSFSNSPNLQAIRLDGNQLTDVNGLFADIKSLLWLNVSDNRLEWFDYALIPQGLQWLDLHKNNIRELGNRFNLDDDLKLEQLDASFNKITRITPSSFPSSIQLLFLNDNLISLVEPHTFLQKTNLSRVDLYANQITHMDSNALRLTPVESGKQLPEFYIGGNPFQCDCTMEWLQTINKLDQLHVGQRPRVMDLDSIYCKLLHNREVSYMPLIHVESSQFLCTYKTHCFTVCRCCDFDACDCEMTCPNNCTCYHNQLWSSNVVDCSGSGYLEMPNTIPMDASEVYLDGNSFGELSSHSFIGRKNLIVIYANNSNIEAIYNHTFSGLRRLTVLHLEDNKIKQLLGFELSSLESLRELYLQGNLISFIDNRTFLPLRQLEVLRLENNRLTTFQVWQLTSNPYLVEIGLSYNHWTCNCDYVKTFKNWLKQNSVKVIDVTRITCILNNSTNLLGPKMADFNSTKCLQVQLNLVEHQVMNDYLPLLLGTMCMFLLSVVLVCGGFYYRQELRVWVYSRCGLRMCYKTTSFDDQLDKERLFDAYISYSVKDEMFVTQALAPGLESGEQPFRLCLHYRDFNVSGYVADTIIEAVEASKRTIIVLTKNFLLNEWCRFEFKSALHEVFKDRRKRLIFVVSGELPSRDLDPDLRLYLKTNTVIEWGDRQFWQKLRFAMPDVKKQPLHHQRNIYATATASCLMGDRSRTPPTLPPPPPPGKMPPYLTNTTASLPREARTLPHPLWA